MFKIGDRVQPSDRYSPSEKDKHLSLNAGNVGTVVMINGEGLPVVMWDLWNGSKSYPDEFLERVTQ